MLGHKARNFKLLNEISLEDLVPEDNFYRRFEDCMDLGFIHELVASCFSEIGRPSIDPIVFFKLQLIALFEGIRSERRLMETANHQYICPEGQILPLFSKRKTEQNRIYRADVDICDACPVKARCTNSKSGRYIFRSFFQEELDRAEAYQQTEMYQNTMQKRSVWVEPLFGEAKQFHRLRRFRLRVLVKVNIEGVLIAIGQNIKRLMKTKADEIRSFSQLIHRFARLSWNDYFFNRLCFG